MMFVANDQPPKVLQPTDRTLDLPAAAVAAQLAAVLRFRLLAVFAMRRDEFDGAASQTRAQGIAVTACTQPDLVSDRIDAARCIDARRLSDVAGKPVTAREKGNRKGCACHESRDIGAYDTCPHGCIYCYAVGSPAAAKRRHAAHDAAAEML